MDKSKLLRNYLQLVLASLACIFNGFAVLDIMAKESDFAFFLANSLVVACSVAGLLYLAGRVEVSSLLRTDFSLFHLALGGAGSFMVVQLGGIMFVRYSAHALSPEIGQMIDLIIRSIVVFLMAAGVLFLPVAVVVSVFAWMSWFYWSRMASKAIRT